MEHSLIERRTGRKRRMEDCASAVFCVRLTPDERRRLDAAAASNRQDPSTFARDAVLNAIEETMESVS